MSERGPVYRVKWADGDWVVVDAVGARVSDRLRSQSQAVVHAKERAWIDGSAQIIVHDRHDAVVSEFFYQREQRRALAVDDLEPSLAATRPERR